MTEPDPSEEQVRRLLADARHDEPMPRDVVDRLDRVLAGLQGESRRTPAPIDLSARRRRRVGRNLLVAAAAVVVLGAGISQVDLSGQGDRDASSDSGGSGAESSARDSESGGGRLLITTRPLVLSSEEFDVQVARLGTDHSLGPLSSLSQDAHSPQNEAPETGDGTRAGVRAWCDDPAWGSGKRIPVRYDGRRGVLVLRPASGEDRAADLYLCGETVATRSTTIPVG